MAFAVSAITRYLRGPGIFTQHAQRLGAAHPRQIDIHQNHCRQVRPRKFYPKTRVGGRQQMKIATKTDNVPE